MTQTVNGDLFIRMLDNGARNLTNQHQEINALNVFPVPDGDTGTNMNLTFTNGIKDAKAVKSTHVGEISKALSRGLLMGARGNSGVILSQIFRGFSQSVEQKSTLNSMDIAEAFMQSKETAYKAVMRPVEGTILTVLREGAKKAYDWRLSNDNASIEEYFEVLIEASSVSLDNTPNLLPVLKEVGVVDSGGKGYLTVLEGFMAALKGEVIEVIEIVENENAQSALANMEHDEFGYCTEFIVQIDPKQKRYDENVFRAELEGLGNSIVVVTDEDLVKVHVHTLNPGNALNLGQQYGEFLKLKIENMSEQHHTIMESDTAHAIKTKKDPAKYAIVTVAAGDGIHNLFKELRAEYIISGGQTMNPSTEDFVDLINSINAEHVFILPNNSNIILAANQARDILEDRDVHVLETKSIPQGLSACIMFNPEISVEENLEEMLEAVRNTTTAQVTYAIKDTVFENLEIKKDDFMGILEKDIIVCGPDRVDTTQKLLQALITEDKEIVTVLTGEDVSDEEMEAMGDYIENNFDVECEIHRGNQPVYSYIFGAE